ncbi:MAG: histidine kinase [Cyclobacteriaceae bacterium]|nr:histidine kinase [Cyclobacteriaceae bacterium HetDA_MAG_MS6]
MKEKGENKYKIVFHACAVLLLLLPPYFVIGQYNFRWEFFLFSGSMVGFYLVNILIFVPKFLKRSKYWAYAGALFACSVFAHLVFRNILAGKQLIIVDHAKREHVVNTRSGAKPFPLFPLMMIFGLGSGFEIFFEWEKQKRKNEESDKEKAYTELMFLKSQINPHFLFNTLNNIYSLATAKSEKTEAAILLLSDMLRYNLYEASGEKISIRKEVELIENFIALQKIRLVDDSKINIDFQNQVSREVFIEPMLLLPFVENAFKHGISYKRESMVDVSLKTNTYDLSFEVVNSVNDSTVVEMSSRPSGIGLENVKKRLQMLYPNKHNLFVGKEGDVFRATLNVDLA